MKEGMKGGREKEGKKKRTEAVKEEDKEKREKDMLV